MQETSLSFCLQEICDSYNSCISPFYYLYLTERLDVEYVVGLLISLVTSSLSFTFIIILPIPVIYTITEPIQWGSYHLLVNCPCTCLSMSKGNKIKARRYILIGLVFTRNLVSQGSYRDLTGILKVSRIYGKKNHYKDYRVIDLLPLHRDPRKRGKVIYDECNEG